MTIIEKIKAEIERLYNGEAPKHDQQCDFDDGYFTGIDAISKFLDTLESEKPMNQEGLENEIKRYLREEHDRDTTVGDVARHFAKWGAEHLADARKTLEIKPGDEVTINGHKFVYDKDKGYVTIVKSEELVPNDLEEAAEKSLRLAGFHNMETRGMDWKDAFIAGAKWQKEQMMKEAVEGEVVKDWDNNLSIKTETISGFKFGDKVRVIVLKKED